MCHRALGVLPTNMVLIKFHWIMCHHMMYPSKIEIYVIVYTLAEQHNGPSNEIKFHKVKRIQSNLTYR